MVGRVVDLGRTQRCAAFLRRCARSLYIHLSTSNRESGRFPLSCGAHSDGRYVTTVKQQGSRDYRETTPSYRDTTPSKEKKYSASPGVLLPIPCRRQGIGKDRTRIRRRISAPARSGSGREYTRWGSIPALCRSRNCPVGLNLRGR